MRTALLLLPFLVSCSSMRTSTAVGTSLVVAGGVGAAVGTGIFIDRTDDIGNPDAPVGAIVLMSGGVVLAVAGLIALLLDSSE